MRTILLHASSRRSRRGGGWGYGFLALAVAIALGWIWWQNRQPQNLPATAPKPKSKPGPATLERRSAPTITNAASPVIATVTNLTPITNLASPSEPQVTSTNQRVESIIASSGVTNAGPLTQAASSSSSEERPSPSPVRDILEAQIALSRQAISPGSLDGVLGRQTRAALRAFQTRAGLPATGELDARTRSILMLDLPVFTNRVIAREDLDRLCPLGTTWLSKSKQDRLEYETLLELVAEASHAHPRLVRRFNPGIDWTTVTPGTAVVVPWVERAAPVSKASFLRIRLGDKTIEAYDASTNLLAHFPCSIAQRVEKRPVGTLAVKVIAPNPDYRFNPEVFPESAEARQIGRPLMIAPGPNNPVGTAWIGLNRPGYGIHGTPHPEDVGRTESHGCFRLANWNAEYLVQLVWIGLPVLVEP